MVYQHLMLPLLGRKFYIIDKFNNEIKNTFNFFTLRLSQLLHRLQISLCVGKKLCQDAQEQNLSHKVYAEKNKTTQWEIKK